MNLPGSISLPLAVSVWRRNVTVYRHTWKTNILPNFFDPVLYLLGMGLGLGMFMGREINGQTYLAFIAPGLMASSAMQGASFEATYNMFIKMTFSKLYDAFLATPAQIQDIAFGELLWAMTRAMVYGMAFLFVLTGFTIAGYPVLTSWWVLLTPLAMALTGMMFALIGQLFTASIKTIEYYGFYYTLWLTPLFLFSGIFFPLKETAYGYGEQIAWFTPLYHAVRLIRGLAQTEYGPPGMDQLVSVLWMASLSLVLLWAVPRRMRQRMIK